MDDFVTEVADVPMSRETKQGHFEEHQGDDEVPWALPACLTEPEFALDEVGTAQLEAWAKEARDYVHALEARVAETLDKSRREFIHTDIRLSSTIQKIESAKEALGEISHRLEEAQQKLGDANSRVLHLNSEVAAMEEACRVSGQVAKARRSLGKVFEMDAHGEPGDNIDGILARCRALAEVRDLLQSVSTPMSPKNCPKIVNDCNELYSSAFASMVETMGSSLRGGPVLKIEKCKLSSTTACPELWKGARVLGVDSDLVCDVAEDINSNVLRALLKHSHGLVVQQTEDEWHVQLKNTGTVQFSDVASALESMADFISAAVFSGDSEAFLIFGSALWPGIARRLLRSANFDISTQEERAQKLEKEMQGKSFISQQMCPLKDGLSTRDEAEQKAERSRILGRARKELIADTVEGVTETVEVDSKQLECLVTGGAHVSSMAASETWLATCPDRISKSVETLWKLIEDNPSEKRNLIDLFIILKRDAHRDIIVNDPVKAGLLVLDVSYLSVRLLLDATKSMKADRRDSGLDLLLRLREAATVVFAQAINKASDNARQKLQNSSGSWKRGLLSSGDMAEAETALGEAVESLKKLSTAWTRYLPEPLKLPALAVAADATLRELAELSVQALDKSWRMNPNKQDGSAVAALLDFLLVSTREAICPDPKIQPPSFASVALMKDCLMLPWEDLLNLSDDRLPDAGTSLLSRGSLALCIRANFSVGVESWPEAESKAGLLADAWGRGKGVKENDRKIETKAHKNADITGRVSRGGVFASSNGRSLFG
ncbi:hypothetical protein Pmar_PMAR028177 [Perkinsus marinus ATCC 50983]|uniref:Uncharacterized protein n=1 Tax=Perkinsus marinus (strain ATCC 50983 / TXsc) TaxID=423536 RepID=C5LB61_PERM5|nr:hypothetical protein Pmar_PMAR028177 [Perkinsus marinus ATCC 50983]EER05989.1 hypothetical protein Pmar_PMAR028177 [Perkinsus marinus ATCC 50983]|eukprot:XP_002774173.1 hypothetical protein Pmar_PMAR028177 [Perkinsus marinus ATCC 50983]